MKHEFNNRIDAQREVLKIVNGVGWVEELYGLSSGSIARWVESNEIASGDELRALVVLVAGKLFFLANKSQEQVAEEYRSLSIEVANLTQRIKDAVEVR